MPSAMKLHTYFGLSFSNVCMRRSWYWWAVTASDACMAQTGAVSIILIRQLTNGQPACLLAFVPKTDILNILWYFTSWLSICFFLFLMNFVSRHGSYNFILRVHNKSVKCDASLSKGSKSMLFRWGGHIFHVFVRIPPAYCSAKITKIERVFPEYCTATFFSTL